MVELENYAEALERGTNCIALVTKAFAEVDCENKTPEESFNEGAYMAAKALDQAMLNTILSI